jgi:uncharacterized phage protein (TIGR02220 family)
MENEKEIIQPNYYGILPANVRYCKALPPAAKVLFTELSALTNKNGYCHASNKYFAELYDVSERIVSNWFKQLEQNGFIRIEIYKTQIGTARKVYIAGEPQNNNSHRKISSIAQENIFSNAHRKEFSEPQEEKFIHNNKNINTNNLNNKKGLEAEQSSTLFPEKNNSIENVFEEVEKKPTAKTKCEIPAEEAKYFFEVSQILQEFEALMSVKFKIPETKKLFERYGQANKIIKVLQQGHSLEDCLNVIKLKHSEWFNDAKMRAYIVPDTIFAPNNFGKYLTQLQISNNNPQPQNNGNFNKQQQQQGSRFARSFAKHFAQDANNDVPF